MRILFFGDYSNLHAVIAQELKQRGHDVTVISDGGRYMDTAKDILLDRYPGKLNAVKYLYEVNRLVRKIKDFDVVQLINSHFLNLRPEKIKYFYDILRNNNRSVFLTLAGDDFHFVDACMKSDTFQFSEFMVGKQFTEFEKISQRGRLWISESNRKLSEHIYSTMSGAVSVLPEYDIPSRPILKDKLTFANIPINLKSLNYSELPEGKLKIFIGIRGGMEIQKGTGLLLKMAERIEKRFPELCEVECVRNLPLKEYLHRMNSSHIVLDQFYSYSPATNALQAMALGKVVGTGGQPEYYDYIREAERPIIPLSPLKSSQEWEEYLVSLISDRQRMEEMSRQGRQLVESHNDIGIVVDKFENHWKKIIGKSN
ncbi:MAG: hypothetical protein K2N05_12235 [Muribaculaceae bacterium]|nr:hypothetical protein [Muribaculaceae bacterium]